MRRIQKLADEVIASLTNWNVRDDAEVQNAFNALRSGIENARLGLTQTRMEHVERSGFFLVEVDFQGPGGMVELTWRLPENLAKRIRDQASSEDSGARYMAVAKLLENFYSRNFGFSWVSQPQSDRRSSFVVELPRVHVDVDSMDNGRPKPVEEAVVQMEPDGDVLHVAYHFRNSSLNKDFSLVESPEKVERDIRAAFVRFVSKSRSSGGF